MVQVSDQPSASTLLLTMMTSKGGPAQGICLQWYSMPGGSSPSFDELELSTVQPTLEKNKQKLIEPAKEPITIYKAKTPLVINIFQHPLYDKKTHLTSGVKSLEELHEVIKNANGPFWFEFLSKAIDYNHRLFNQHYKTEQTLQRIRNKKNQTIQERDIAIQQQSNIQKLLCSAQLKAERLNQENKIFIKRLEIQPELFIHDQNCLNSIQHSSLTPQTHNVDDRSYSPFEMRSQQKNQRNHLYSCNWHSRSRSCLWSHTCVLHQQDYSRSRSQADWKN